MQNWSMHGDVTKLGEAPPLHRTCHEKTSLLGYPANPPPTSSESSDFLRNTNFGILTALLDLSRVVHNKGASLLKTNATISTLTKTPPERPSLIWAVHSVQQLWRLHPALSLHPPPPLLITCRFHDNACRSTTNRSRPLENRRARLTCSSVSKTCKLFVEEHVFSLKSVLRLPHLQVLHCNGAHLTVDTDINSEVSKPLRRNSCISSCTCIRCQYSGHRLRALRLQ